MGLAMYASFQVLLLFIIPGFAYQTPLCELLRYGNCVSYTTYCKDVKWGISYCPSGQQCCQDQDVTSKANRCKEIFRGTCMTLDRSRCSIFSSFSGAPYCPDYPDNYCCLQLKSTDTQPPRITLPPTRGPKIPEKENTRCENTLEGKCMPKDLSKCKYFMGSPGAPYCSKDDESCCIAPVEDATCEGHYGGTCEFLMDCEQDRGLPGPPLCKIENKWCCIKKKPEVTQPPITLPPNVPKDIFKDKACGSPKYPVSSWRVVGGTRSEHGSWPWQISLRLWDQHICGGSIIDNQWILSAAHCFGESKDPYDFTVRVGEHREHLYDRTEIDHYVSDIFIHESYPDQSNRDPHDIALLKLRTPITFNDHVKKVCLSTEYNEFDDHKDCWVTGWGDTIGTADNRYLQQLQSYLVDNERCNEVWRGGVKEGMVCAGNGWTGACSGDSGGPLVCRRNHKFFQVGVVSWGTKSCSEPELSSVYTRVASYIPWIYDKIHRY